MGTAYNEYLDAHAATPGKEPLNRVKFRKALLGEVEQRIEQHSNRKKRRRQRQINKVTESSRFEYRHKLEFIDHRIERDIASFDGGYDLQKRGHANCRQGLIGNGLEGRKDGESGSDSSESDSSEDQ